MPGAKRRGAHQCKQRRADVGLQRLQQRHPQRPRCVGKGARPVHISRHALRQPRPRQPAGVDQRRVLGHKLKPRHLGLVRPGGEKPAVGKPVVQLHSPAEEGVVVEVEKPLRQARDAVDIGLDVARVEQRQRCRRDDVAVIHHRQARPVGQPVRPLPVGDDVNMAVAGEKTLQRPQAVAQLVVVAVAALDVAKRRTAVWQCRSAGSLLGCGRLGGHLAGRHPLGGRLPALAPGRVVAIDPEIDHIDKITARGRQGAGLRHHCGAFVSGAGV